MQAVHVRLEVADLSLDPRDGAAVLILEHTTTGRVFPIWLGDREAAVIARAHSVFQEAKVSALTCLSTASHSKLAKAA